MKNKVKIVVFSLFAFLLVACGEESNDEKIRAPISSDFENLMYDDIVAKFVNAGFTNVKTEKIDDLVFGWLTKEGEVEEVTIDGETTFSTSSRYPSDATVIVTYHAFSEKESATDSSSTTESNAKSKPSEIEQSSEESVEKEEDESSETKEEDIITVENNEEFFALLKTKDDTSDPVIAEFAKKYAGRTIEFDGNIAYMSNHDNYKTRYDFLILAGDYSENTTTGPNFQFRDVSAFDLKLIGDNIPDFVGQGDNLHFVAKIIEFDQTQGLFFIDPVSTTVR